MDIELRFQKLSADAILPAYATADAAGTDRIYDGGEGTARETARRLALCGMLRKSDEPGTVRILNSDPSEERIRFCRTLLLSAVDTPPVFS